MSKKRLFALMLWSAIAATGAIADVADPPLGAESPSAATQGDVEENATRLVLEQFRSTHVALSQAIAIAEHLHNGSRTTDISFEISGPPVYRVRTVTNETV